MGLFGGTKLQNSDEYKSILAENEQLLAVYKLLINIFCFTDKRLIYLENRLLSRKKRRVSIPYHAIKEYVIESASFWERESKIILYCHHQDFKLKFKKGTDLKEVEDLLTQYICN